MRVGHEGLRTVGRSRAAGGTAGSGNGERIRALLMPAGIAERERYLVGGGREAAGTRCCGAAIPRGGQRSGPARTRDAETDAQRAGPLAAGDTPIPATVRAFVQFGACGPRCASSAVWPGQK